MIYHTFDMEPMDWNVKPKPIPLDRFKEIQLLGKGKANKLNDIVLYYTLDYDLIGKYENYQWSGLEYEGLGIA